jgi:hypothetical protein
MIKLIHHKDAKNAKCLIVLVKEHLDKSSPRKRGSSEPLILKTLDSRLRGKTGLFKSSLKNFFAFFASLR